VRGGSVAAVHPIERLRAVARAQGVDQRLLAREAATTLGVLADEPFGLVMSCRRLLERHPGAGTLWWACARLLDSADPRLEARVVARALADDAVVRTLALDLPERASVLVVPDPTGGSVLAERLDDRRDDLVVLEVDDPAFDLAAAVEAVGPPSHRPATPGTGPTIVVVEAAAAGPDAFLAADGTIEALGPKGDRPAPVWLVVGAGRRLPASLYAALLRRAHEPGGAGSATSGAPAAAVAAGGSESVPQALVDRVLEPRVEPCPAPAELLRQWSS
jgi:hypothetical protein